MDAPTAALQESLAVAGVELLEPLGPRRWRGRDGGGPVLVTVVRPRSRVQLAGVRARADRLAALRHRGLAEVLGCVGTGGSLAVVQRELDGTDLATVLRRRPQWRIGEALGVVADVADALAVLHGAGLVHGDVSPANVVIDESGRAVLVDLLSGSDPEEDGTPGWAAPERLAGASPAGDVFSLGTIGAALLDACPAPEPPEEVPGTASGFLARATGADPSVRPSAAELAAAARTAGTTEPVRPVDRSVLAGALLQEKVTREVDGERTVRRPRPVRRRHRRRGPARGVVPAVVGVVLVAGTVAGLVHVRATPSAPAVAILAGPPDAAGAERAATGLTHRRAAALAGGNLPVLLSVTEPGSPAAGVDRQLWRAQNRGPGDVVVRHARAVPADAGEWRVAVEVETGGGSQDVVLRLARAEGRWLVRAVEAG